MDDAHFAAAAFLARYRGRTLDAYRHDLRSFFVWAAVHASGVRRRRVRTSSCTGVEAANPRRPAWSAESANVESSAYVPVMRGRRGRTPKWVDGSSRCAFCGKRKEEVDKLIAGPGVCICNECVALCVDIIEKDRAPSR